MTTKATTKDDVHTLKLAYHRIQKRSLAKTPAEFNEKCAQLLLANKIDPETAKPADWLKAAKHVLFPCGRCAGTGLFITMVVNGKPTGPGGICYRCNGKGAQNDSDRRRNYGHDMYKAGKAVAADLNVPQVPPMPAQTPPVPVSKVASKVCQCCEQEEATTHFMGHDMCEECFAENAHAATHAKYAGDDA